MSSNKAHNPVPTPCPDDATMVHFGAYGPALETLGLPETVVKFLVEQRYPARYRMYFRFYLAAVLVLFLVPPILLGVYMFRYAETLPDQHSADGYFYDGSHGWGAVVLLIGVMLAAALVVGRLGYLMPKPLMIYVATQSFLDSVFGRGEGQGGARWLTRHAARQGTREEEIDPVVYLLTINERMIRWVGRSGLALLVLGVGLCVIDFGQYAIGTAAGVETHSVFGDELVSWNELESVRVGCYILDNEGEEEPVGRYQLTFTSGQDFNAFPGDPTPERLARLQMLNKRLREQGKTFRRATSDGKDLWVDGCGKTLAAKYGLDEEVVHQLVQLDE